jgi:hypothetical protein
VFQVEHHLVHRDVSFEEHPARIVEDGPVPVGNG